MATDSIRNVSRPVGPRSSPVMAEAPAPALAPVKSADLFQARQAPGFAPQGPGLAAIHLSPAAMKGTESAKISYEAREGDTLKGLAERFGLPEKMLWAINPSLNDGIQPGQSLDIPGWKTTTIQPGDTLWGIAKQNGSTVVELAKANEIAHPDRIAAGDPLSVPSPAKSYVRAGELATTYLDALTSMDNGANLRLADPLAAAIVDVEFDAASRSVSVAIDYDQAKEMMAKMGIAGDPRDSANFMKFSNLVYEQPGMRDLLDKAGGIGVHFVKNPNPKPTEPVSGQLFMSMSSDVQGTMTVGGKTRDIKYSGPMGDGIIRVDGKAIDAGSAPEFAGQLRELSANPAVDQDTKDCAELLLALMKRDFGV